MKRFILLGAAGLVVSGCSWFQDDVRVQLPPGAVVVSSSPGMELFSVCDRGNMVYRSEKNGQVFIVKDGCSPGGAGGPAPAAVAAVTERTVERTPPAPAPAPQCFLATPTLGNSFVLTPCPPGVPPPLTSIWTPPVATPVDREERAPVVINVLPAPAPEPAPVPEPPAAKPAPKAAPKAPAAKKVCPC